MSDKAVNWLMDRADKLGGFIDELAKQLGVAATHVYEVLVKQQFVEGISLLVKAGIWILVLLLVWTLMKKLVFNNWGKLGDDGQFACFFVILFVSIASVIIGFKIVEWLTLGIKMLLNPEYYALDTLMEFVKGQVDKK